MTEDARAHLQEEKEERLLHAAVEEGEDEVDESDEVEDVDISRVGGFVLVVQLREEGDDLARGECEVAGVVTLEQLGQIFMNEVTRLALRRNAETEKEVESFRDTLRRPHQFLQLLRLQQLNNTVAERALCCSGHVFRIRRVHFRQHSHTIFKTR